MPAKTAEALAGGQLSDCDPQVLRLTRFSMSNILLVVLGIVGTLFAGAAYRKGSVGSELKRERPSWTISASVPPMCTLVP